MSASMSAICLQFMFVYFSLLPSLAIVLNITKAGLKTSRPITNWKIFLIPSLLMKTEALPPLMV